MFKNYLLIAWRSLWKHKLSATINIVGLAIGISASLVIFLLVQYDFSFDRFHAGGDRIKRVVSKFDFSGEVFYNSGVAYPLSQAMQQEVTGLEVVAPFSQWDMDLEVSIPSPNSQTPAVFRKQHNTVFADERYFTLINYTWLAGTPKNALRQPYQVVLTESNARLFYPRLSPAAIIGRDIVFNDTVHAVVSGIVKDIPQHTDFTFTTFISWPTLANTSLRPYGFDQWNSTTGSSQLLIKFAPGTKQAQIEKQLAALFKKYHKTEPGEKEAKSPFLLQPLADIHFDANYGLFDNRIAHKPTLYGLLAIAAFLLVLGCINFINLATAQASQRAKEIGIRKTMGSSKAQLVVQFLAETFLLTLLATVLSVLITPLLLQVFKDFIPEGLHLDAIWQPGIFLFLLGLTVLVSLLSGFYPAMVLSGYKPVLVLKNQIVSGSGKGRRLWLRKSLTVSQFVIAQVFIIAVLLVSHQISYTLSTDLGFKKDAIVYFNTSFYDTVKSNKYVLQQKLKTIPGIQMISVSSSPISSNSTWSTTINYKDGKKEVETNVYMKMGDTNYVKLYGLHLLAGRQLAASDTVKEFIINETYSHTLGFIQPQQAIGKYLTYNNKQVPIAGVVKDFHQQSMHTPIKPLAISTARQNTRTFNIALQPGNTANWKPTIAAIEKVYKELYPKYDFEYHFEDETIAKFYESEQHILALLRWATGLTIFISCLGLLGLAIFTTAQRTKEIGVRKVLGATATKIVTMISKEFVWLVLLAFVIAAPIAWLAMHSWLQNFAYRVNIGWWIFALAGLISVFVALATVSIQAIKAAIANPVKSLRSE